MTPDLVLQSVKLVKKGKTLPLAVPVDKHLPAFRHRSFNLYNIQPGEQGGRHWVQISLALMMSL